MSVGVTKQVEPLGSCIYDVGCNTPFLSPDMYHKQNGTKIVVLVKISCHCFECAILQLTLDVLWILIHRVVAYNWQTLFIYEEFWIITIVFLMVTFLFAVVKNPHHVPVQFDPPEGHRDHPCRPWKLFRK